MAQAEVTNFGHRILLLFVFLACCFRFLEDENVVNLDICVNDASLVQIPDSLQYILRPDDHLGIFNRLILTYYLATEIVRAIASILHINAVGLAILSAVECLDNVWVVHLKMYRTLALSEGHG